MGRQSLAEPRRQQMLAGIARCIGRHGLAASTQEVMAQESGFSRSHIRHYLGNRDDVIEAVWDYLMRPYQEQTAATLSAPEPRERLERLLDFLFGPEMERKPEDVAIEALINGASRHPELLEKVDRTYRELEQQVSAQLQAVAPGMAADAADGVAFSLIAMAFGASSFSARTFPESRRQAAHEIANRIVEQLLAEHVG